MAYTPTSTAAAANTAPIGNSSDGKLDASWGGGASSLATLNASSLVVQNPANAQTTPAGSKIPITEAGGGLKAEWSGTGTATSGYALLSNGVGTVPSWGLVQVSTSSGRSDGTTQTVITTSPSQIAWASNASYSFNLGVAPSASKVDVKVTGDGSAVLNQTSTITFTSSVESLFDQESSSDTEFGTVLSVQRTVNDSACTLYISGEGVNNGTDFIETASFVALTKSGTVVTSTTSPKFISSSIYFDGTNSDIITASDVIADWDAAGWTCDFWIKFSTLSGIKGGLAASQASDNGWWAWGFETNGTQLNFFAGTADGNHNITGGPAAVQTGLSTGTWYHVEVGYDDATQKLYVFFDGTKKLEYTGVTQISSGKQRIRMGRTSGDQLHGYLSEVRLRNYGSGQTCAHTANFTPPAAAMAPVSFPTTGRYVAPKAILGLGLSGVASFDPFTFTSGTASDSSLRFLYTTNDRNTTAVADCVWKDHTGATVALANLHTSGSTAAQMSGVSKPASGTLNWLIGIKASSSGVISPYLTSILMQWDGVAPRDPYRNCRVGQSGDIEVQIWPDASNGSARLKNVSGGAITNAEIVITIG